MRTPSLFAAASGVVLATATAAHPASVAFSELDAVLGIAGGGPEDVEIVTTFFPPVFEGAEDIGNAEATVTSSLGAGAEALSMAVQASSTAFGPDGLGFATATRLGEIEVFTTGSQTRPVEVLLDYSLFVSATVTDPGLEWAEAVAGLMLSDITGGGSDPIYQAFIERGTDAFDRAPDTDYGEGTLAGAPTFAVDLVPGEPREFQLIGSVVVQSASEVAPAPIPLPAAGWLLLAGLGGLAVLRRRQRGA